MLLISLTFLEITILSLKNVAYFEVVLIVHFPIVPLYSTNNALNLIKTVITLLLGHLSVHTHYLQGISKPLYV